MFWIPDYLNENKIRGLEKRTFLELGIQNCLFLNSKMLQMAFQIQSLKSYASHNPFGRKTEQQLITA